MLSLDHPEIVREILVFPGGLLPIRVTGKLSLVVKASKEALLTVREKGGFSVYVVPIPTADGQAISLVTAFFDDEDEPLVIRTPLFGGEAPSVELVALLLSKTIDVYFFDALGREWMGYSCSVEDPGSLLATQGDEIRLAPFTRSNSTAILARLGEWFGLRTPAEDARAVKIRLDDALWPPDLAILDVRDGPNDYVGTHGYAITMLERDATRPGYYQERDIAGIVRRFLAPDQIILNPLRRGTAEEYADIVCGTGSAVIIIQAKDSPNTAHSLARSIARKTKTSDSQLKAALIQLSGAWRYTGQGEPVLLTAKGDDIDLYVAGRQLVGVALIREVFPAQSRAVVSAIREWASLDRCLVVLDFPGFAAFSHHFPEEDRWVTELVAYSQRILDQDRWIPTHEFLVGRFLDDRLGG